MIDMPRPRPPHLHSEPNRFGKARWYVRKGHGPRVRLHADYGTDEFWEEYRAAVAGKTPPKKTGPAISTLAWLIERYRDSGAWMALAPATRRARENIFKRVVESAGDQPYAKITGADLIEGRERRAATFAQARHFLDAMRGLFRWALNAKMVKIDPTSGVENPPKKQTEGFPPWTEADVAAYQRQWPIGTRQRVWLDVLLYSGLRRGDAVRYGHQHVRGGVGRIPTEKSGLTVTAIVPVLPVLARTIEAGPCGDITFIAGANGRPLTKESFGNMFRDACDAAGVKGSAHGVRKIAATTAANNGATVSQLKALFGWTDDAMPALYTKSADRERLGISAGQFLANDERTSIPAPKGKVRASGRKPK